MLRATQHDNSVEDVSPPGLLVILGRSMDPIRIHLFRIISAVGYRTLNSYDPDHLRPPPSSPSVCRGSHPYAEVFPTQTFHTFRAHSFPSLNQRETEVDRMTILCSERRTELNAEFAVGIAISFINISIYS